MVWPGVCVAFIICEFGIQESRYIEHTVSRIIIIFALLSQPPFVDHNKTSGRWLGRVTCPPKQTRLRSLQFVPLFATLLTLSFAMDSSVCGYTVGALFVLLADICGCKRLTFVGVTAVSVNMYVGWYSLKPLSAGWVGVVGTKSLCVVDDMLSLHVGACGGYVFQAGLAACCGRKLFITIGLSQ